MENFNVRDEFQIEPEECAHIPDSVEIDGEEIMQELSAAGISIAFYSGDPETLAKTLWEKLGKIIRGA